MLMFNIMFVKILLFLSDIFTWIKTVFNDFSLIIENFSNSEFVGSLRLIWYYLRAEENRYIIIIIVAVIITIWLITRRKNEE